MVRQVSETVCQTQYASGQVLLWLQIVPDAPHDTVIKLQI